ncbi:DUF7289 family protein [Halosimplex pelagicum]|uniref:DUF7305 domain-containing protein n=1 Tax=Halosimplex pelagicum TaxID=869886 RepID=A0A7D5SW65_9EURY|nr:hypothetical protein [Halosimplex pelagicum]QLH82787.1 hypothetical protein HZS54_14655 [Halosimplex pelagicum]
MSSVLGIVLLFAVVLGGTAVVVTVGATALDDTRQQLDTGRAEKTLTQFDSRSAMVALGGTSRQGVDLSAVPGAAYGVDDSAGWMNVTIYNQTADERTTLTNVTLGAVRYENGDRTIAYQGGGVWKGTEAGATMLSPPEFHFREATLTLPIITVSGTPTLGSGATVTKAEPTRVRYPNATADPHFTNPLESGHVNVTVHSEYYEAWGRFFAQRTEGNVSYDHARGTARAKLVVPFHEGYDQVLAATQPGGIRMNGNDDPPPRSATGINYPLVDERIENRIDECESDDAACEEMPADNEITSGGTYFTDSYFSGTLDVDNPGDDVTVVVDENFSPDGVTITSSHNTTVLVGKSFDMGSNDFLNDGGQASDLSVVMHSNGAVNGNGNFRFVGLLYAPGSDCNMNGGGAVEPNIVGGAVCERVTVNGNPNDFDYDPSVANTDLELTGDVTPVTYLHVTENPVNVTGK